MKGIILLDNYFEDTEALSTLDVLNRAGFEMKKVNMTNNNVVTSQNGIKLIVDDYFKDVDLLSYDFLVIPGGRAVSNSLINDKRVYDAIKVFNDNKKLIACICAAPVLLKEYLTNKTFTCFPSYAKYINGNYSAKGIEVVDNFILAKSMYYSIDFGLEIVKYYEDNQMLLKSLKAE